MNRFILLAISLLLCGETVFAQHLHKEKYYQHQWAVANNAQEEVVLDDGARVDCLTKEYAVEFDFAKKWAESIGQSLYYGIKTNKKPAVVLIMENPKQEQRYLKRLQTVAKKHNITVFTMN